MPVPFSPVCVISFVTTLPVPFLAGIDFCFQISVRFAGAICYNHATLSSDWHATIVSASILFWVEEHVKRIITLAVVFLLCCVVALSWYFNGSRILLAKHSDNAVWSKDSKALFYMQIRTRPERPMLCRYDLATGKRRWYYVERVFNRGSWDISPDQRRMVFLREWNIAGKDPGMRLCVASLGSRSATTIYETENSLNAVYWLSQDTLLVEEHLHDSPEPISSFLTMSPSGKNRHRVGEGQDHRLYAGSGLGFAYLAKDGIYHYHDLASNVDTAFHLSGVGSESQDTEFLHLSQDKIVYWRWGLGNEFGGMLDLKTMRDRRIHMPQPGTFMEISPDLTKYWLAVRPTGDFLLNPPPKLYLGRLPAQTVREIRRP